MHLESMLKKFSQEIDLETIPLENNNGEYQITIGNAPSFIMKEMHPGFSLQCAILKIPTVEPKENLFTYLLKANLNYQGTGEFVLGINQLETHITLSKKIDYDVGYIQLYELIEEFMNYVDYWSVNLSQFT